jgi:hypothetical protein
MGNTRSQWEFNNPNDQDNLICVTRTEYGLYIEAEEEKAVDSYNHTFNCAIAIPVDKAKQLLAFLRQALE